jgi:hypothetical protein
MCRALRQAGLVAAGAEPIAKALFKRRRAMSRSWSRAISWWCCGRAVKSTAAKRLLTGRNLLTALAYAGAHAGEQIISRLAIKRDHLLAVAKV